MTLTVREPVKGVCELSHGDERLAANCSTVWINLQDVDQVDLKARQGEVGVFPKVCKKPTLATTYIDWEHLLLVLHVLG